MLDSIFGQSKVYKSFCQWYVLALNKGLSIWKRNCTLLASDYFSQI